MKKKKVWKTPSMEKLSMKAEELVRKTLCDIREGRHPFCTHEERLFELLEKQVDLIDGIEEKKIKLELLARFLNTDAVLAECESDDFADLYADMAAYFVGASAYRRRRAFCGFSDVRKFLARIYFNCIDGRNSRSSSSSCA